MVKHFDINADFFQVNPHFKVLSTLNELDSETMWVVYMYTDPAPDNPLGQAPEEVKRIEIEKNYVKGPVDWDKIKEYSQLYKEAAMTAGERAFATWTRKLNERAAFLDSLEYTEETWESLDAIMKNSKVIFDHYEKVAEQYNEQKAKSSLRGGGKKSASEKGLI